MLVCSRLNRRSTADICEQTSCCADVESSQSCRCCCVDEGDLIEIRMRTHTQHDWWEGAGRDGRLGIFPANYVQLLWIHCVIYRQTRVFLLPEVSCFLYLDISSIHFINTIYFYLFIWICTRSSKRYKTYNKTYTGLQIHSNVISQTKSRNYPENSAAEKVIQV